MELTLSFLTTSSWLNGVSVHTRVGLCGLPDRPVLPVSTLAAEGK